MKSQVLQSRFPAARRGALLASLAVALSPAALAAQGGAPAPALDPACRCFVGGDSTVLGEDGRDRDHAWALLGAAGLALLAGLPMGGAGAPAIPFADLPSAPAAAPLGEVAGLPPGGAMPALPSGATPIAGSPGGAPVALAPLAPLPVPPLGFAPPKTATHLPLLAAAGVLLLGAGGLLARREARRQRRRRRRAVAI